jgi:hypothetical protein
METNMTIIHNYICIVRRRTSRDSAASISLQYGEWSAECKEDGNTEILVIALERAALHY